MNYYNEFDPKAAAWLRELIKAKLIPAGTVDERTIADVRPDDLVGFTQCHFFAGIGGWPLALRLAGWPEYRPVWTGSCPCQPFSAAGKGLGTADSRHLWPVFAKLIGECKPPTVFGEQVASKAGREWLAGVFADLEGMGYHRAGADLCAASVGAPHIRQRLFWCGLAHAECSEWWPSGERGDVPSRREQAAAIPGGGGEAGGLADAGGGQCQQRLRPQGDGLFRPANDGAESGLGNPDNQGPQGRVGGELPERSVEQAAGAGGASFWSSAIWHPCRDGKARRIEPAIFPLAHGIPGRVGILRGAGNAIVPQVAEAFITAYMETE